MYLRIIPFLAVFVFIAAREGEAQTYVGGTISTNTSWTVSGSPYIVQQNVTVDQNVGLTLEPGVTVKFRSGKSIIVHGQLRAVGTKDNPIQFMPDTIPAEPQFVWSGIYLSDLSSPFKVLSENGSYFKYCIFSYSGSPNLTIDPTGNTAFTIRSEVSLGVNQCQFFYSACGISGGNSSRVSNNLFIQNTADYLTGYLIRTGQNSAIFQNLFYRNACAHEAGMLSLSKNIKVYNNLFIENEFLEFYPAFKLKDSCLFYNNTLTDNYLLSIVLDGGLFYNNTVHRNQAAFQTVELMVCNPHFIHNNLAQNTSLLPGLPVEMQSAVGQDTAVVSLNYWGKSDSTSIAQMIKDRFDNADHCLIDFMPFQAQPDTLAPVLPPLNVRKGINWSNGATVVYWEPTPSTDATGYNVYYGDFTGYSFSTKINAGAVQSIELIGVPADSPIGVTAYDQFIPSDLAQYVGHESWFTMAEADSTVGVIPVESRMIHIVPNPSSGTVRFVLPYHVEGISCCILDCAGRIVEHRIAFGSFSMDMKQSGLYFFHWQAPGQAPQCQKFVVLPSYSP